MNLLECMEVSAESIRANKLRSALTMLGVIFGVGAVIAAVSMTQGARRATLEQFASAGTNQLTIRPGFAGRGPVASGMGSAVTLTQSDAYAMVELIPEVTAVAPEVNTRQQVEAGSENTNTRVIGTSTEAEVVSNYEMVEGRFFTQEDVDRRRKVAVLGATVVEALFGAGEPVAGERVKINGTSFEVLGQYKPKGTGGFGDPDDQVIIPISTAIYRIVGGTEGSTTSRETVSTIIVRITNMEASQRAQAAIKELLRQRHGLKPGEDDDFRIFSVADLVAGAQQASATMTLLFGSVAAVSLIVGGIGIMNIMLVSVTERTREIGLRKAIGATPSDIMLQFLIEALSLSLAGGFLGVALGVMVSYLARRFGLNTDISMPWVILAFSFAAAVGIVFGMLPARKAARLNPVEAIRHE